MDYIHPNDRAEVIMQKLNGLSNTLLKRFHQELLESIPNAKIVKNKIIIRKNDNKTKLEVTIPVTNELCSQIISQEEIISMHWTVKVKMSDGLVFYNKEPVIHPLSVTRIIEWIQHVEE
jgi:hypothetical protein